MFRDISPNSVNSLAIANENFEYALEWWIDNVELISGPVLSDMAQGCQVPAGPAVQVCGLQNCGTPPNTYQCGCRLGTSGLTWTLEPTYLSGPNQSVGAWTNNGTCAMGQNTSQSSYNYWLAQSIVDQAPNGSDGAIPSFNYTNTSVGAWLCRSVYNPIIVQCAINFDAQYCPNNSSPQGQIFYANFGPNNLPPTYNVYAVDSCNGPEGASDKHSYVSALGTDGFDAIVADMETSCTHVPPPK
jgi:hypothetical protein